MNEKQKTINNDTTTTSTRTTKVEASNHVAGDNYAPIINVVNTRPMNFCGKEMNKLNLLCDKSTSAVIDRVFIYRNRKRDSEFVFVCELV